MTQGYRRRGYQLLPESGARVCCVQIDDHGFSTREWFDRSLKRWVPYVRLTEPMAQEVDDLVGFGYRTWNFVLVVPWISVRDFWCANDGMQAWRHKATGYVVPDHCRQTDGCPEVWNSSDLKGKKELLISNLEQIEEFVILDHAAQTRSRSAFPDHALQRVMPTS